MQEITDNKIIVINTGVRELIFPLDKYGNSKVTDKRGALPSIESVRFMPGLNIPLHSAVVGPARRPLTETELDHVLKSEHMRRLTDTGTITVTKDLATAVTVNERAKLARSTSDVVCLRAWLGQESNEKVKSEIEAQLAEINENRPEGDYRDVKIEKPSDSASPGF